MIKLKLKNKEKIMLQALRDEVIIKPLFEENKGLIEIPAGALKYKQYDGQVFGEIVSIGQKYPYKLQIGDKITFQRFEGVKFIYEGVIYLKLKSKWVLGAIK